MKGKLSTAKARIIVLVLTILLSLPLCAAQSSCEQPVTNNYYNSNNTTNNYYYGSTVTGKPTISPEMIDKLLCKYGNQSTCGTGQALYNGGTNSRIDPAYALAFFYHESNFGTKGVARTNLGLGNIRCTDGYACNEGYRAYPSWEAGYNDWYNLISQLYVKDWGLTTVDTIIPKYAPTADNNNEAAYIGNVKALVSTWRNGNVTVYV